MSETQLLGCCYMQDFNVYNFRACLENKRWQDNVLSPIISSFKAPQKAKQPIYQLA
jgi:hypothetical protein